MSFKLIAKILDNVEIKPTAKFLLIAMASFASDDGRDIFPCVKTLQKKTGLSRMAVFNNLKTLEEQGFIQAVGKQKSGVIIYKIIVEKLDHGSTESVLGGILEIPEGVQQMDEGGIAGIPKSLLNPFKDLKSLKDTGVPEISTEKKERPKSEHYEIAEKIGSITKIDIEIETNKGRLLKRASELKKAGYGVQDLERFETWWYKFDWRGKKGAVPNPEMILSEIGKVKRVETKPREKMTQKEIWEAEAKAMTPEMIARSMGLIT